MDFAALAEAALNESSGVEVHGPVEQGDWLLAMGIRERAAMIGGGEREVAGEIQERGRGQGREKRIAQAVERLIERGGGGMGRIYKVMAVVPEAGGRRRPVGFGGKVSG